MRVRPSKASMDAAAKLALSRVNLKPRMRATTDDGGNPTGAEVSWEVWYQLAGPVSICLGVVGQDGEVEL